MKPIRPIHPHPFDCTLALVELTRGKFAVIDAVDAEAVGQFNWFAKPWRLAIDWYAITTGLGYPRAHLHRFIAERMGIDMSGEIDHRNGDGLDCRRSNLRPATKMQNAFNRKMRCDNQSGIKGVTFYRDGRRLPWGANCSAGGRRLRRYFGTKEEAALAAAEMRRELHGEFARYN